MARSTTERRDWLRPHEIEITRPRGLARPVVLVLTDGLIREVDLSGDLWGPMAEPLKNPTYFAKVRVDPELSTIVWPNGYDLDPDVLHGDYEPAPRLISH